MANSKDPVPTAWKEGALSYSSGLTYDTAKKMIEAAMAEARKQRLLMVIAVTDAWGNLVAFGRMDNAMLASIPVAMDKAFTAAYGKLPTQAWGDLIPGSKPPPFIHERWAAFPGGFPLIRGKQLLGGIGCSGATAHEDTSVARVALAAGGFGTEDADAILKQSSEG